MTSYKDKHGVERVIDIDVPAVERCRSMFGINLYNLAQLGELSGDMMRFLRVVHCVSDYDTNSKAFRSTFEDWWKAHVGDAGDRCVEAFVEALCGFFPERLAAAVRETNRIVSGAINDAWERLEKGLAITPTGSPVVAASTPAA